MKRFGCDSRPLSPLRRAGIAFLLLLGTGCVTSTIRFTRDDAGSGDVPKSRTKVPRNWDYRTRYSVPSDRLAKVAEGYIGTPYRYAGMSRRGVDCSGLVCLIYRDMCRATLPHSTSKLRNLGRKVNRNSARSGDLVFFRRGPFGWVNHVGIFLDGERFIHASVKRGVIYSGLEEPYYKTRFAEMRRVF